MILVKLPAAAVLIRSALGRSFGEDCIVIVSCRLMLVVLLISVTLLRIYRLVRCGLDMLSLKDSLWSVLVVSVKVVGAVERFVLGGSCGMTC